MNQDRFEYRIDGKLHRPNGPAISFRESNYCQWYLNGKVHRYYGSVVADSDDWVIHGRRVK
jgi:hypothetical protein